MAAGVVQRVIPVCPAAAAEGDRWLARMQNRQRKLLCLCHTQVMQDLIGCHHKGKWLKPKVTVGCSLEESLLLLLPQLVSEAPQHI